MAKVTFEFDEFSSNIDGDELQDIKLCTNRWDLLIALEEVSSIIRKLANGKTYKEIYLCILEKRSLHLVLW